MLGVLLRKVGLVPLRDHTALLADLVEARASLEKAEGELAECRGLVGAAEENADMATQERDDLADFAEGARAMLNGLVLRYGSPELWLDTAYMQAGSALPLCRVEGDEAGVTLTPITEDDDAGE